MKRIGYIYKYSESEKKGILVYGSWHSKSNSPLLFGESDCISPVATDQLVYFYLDDGFPSRIERASLINFDKELFDSLITWKENYKNSSDWIQNNTTIKYENLKDVEMPADDYIKFRALKNGHDLEAEKQLFLEENKKKSKRPFRGLIRHFSHVELPEDINDLFDCFGKYKHIYDEIEEFGDSWLSSLILPQNQNHTISVDIRNFSLWLDTSICQNGCICFGLNSDQAKYLYDIFVERKYFNSEGGITTPKSSDDCISPKWSLLLAAMDEQELYKLIKVAPKLQPALPINFCKHHIELLTEKYGMPDVEICELYNRHMISNISTVKEYILLKEKLTNYRYCGTKHKRNEGVPMCKMGQEVIEKLEQLLEDKFNCVFKKNIIDEISPMIDYSILPNKENTVFYNQELIDCSLFMDSCKSFVDSFWNFRFVEELLDQFKKMTPRCRVAFEKAFSKTINDSIVEIVRNEEVDPSSLGYKLEDLNDWVKKETLLVIKPILYEKFKHLENLEDLHHAYKFDFIPKESYCEQYKNLTKCYDYTEFAKDLDDHHGFLFPTEIQQYIVSAIISQVDFSSEDLYYSYDFDYERVCSITDLLKWFMRQEQYHHIDYETLCLAQNEISESLSSEESWELFKKDLISNPGSKNIRRLLDSYYSGYKVKEEYLKKQCFQETLYSDFCSSTDLLLKYKIVDALNLDFLRRATDVSSGVVKLYLWIRKPSDIFDWCFIKQHFGLLPFESQVRLLKYVFYQIAIGNFKIDIDELYSEIKNITPTTCTSVLGILFLLKQKVHEPSIAITNRNLEDVIGGTEQNKEQFLMSMKQVLYKCPGHMAFTHYEQDSEYLFFNGILKRDCLGEIPYFVIQFYDIPVDLFGVPIEYLDDKYIIKAKSVLERNFQFEVLDNKYYIPETYETELRHFVIDYGIDDKCNLVSDKAKSIELGYLPENNAFIPAYTNYRRAYEEADNFVCRCVTVEDVDFGIALPFYDWSTSKKPGIPFYWCNQKICTRFARYIRPISDWENYCFSDFLFILLGQNKMHIKSIWDITSKISRFCCEYYNNKEQDKVISTKQIEETEEIGQRDESFSTFKEKYEEDEPEYDDYNYVSNDNYEAPSHDRYNGSWAQDEMGYSDDDIDTIFDGDPDAYWNID